MSTSPRDGAEAGLATAGSGTGLVVLANSIPPGTWHDIAVYTAPSVSVGIGVAVFFVRARARRAVRRRLLEEIRATEQTLLADPGRSQEEKDAITAKRRALELELLDQDIEQVRLL